MYGFCHRNRLFVLRPCVDIGKYRDNWFDESRRNGNIKFNTADKSGGGRIRITRRRVGEIQAAEYRLQITDYRLEANTALRSEAPRRFMAASDAQTAALLPRQHNNGDRTSFNRNVTLAIHLVLLCQFPQRIFPTVTEHGVIEF